MADAAEQALRRAGASDGLILAILRVGLLIHEGVHPKKIAERLGHSSIKLTMDTYGHLFDGSDRESAERMDRLFGRKPDPDDPQGQAEVEEKKRAKLFVMPGRKAG